MINPFQHKRHPQPVRSLLGIIDRICGIKGCSPEDAQREIRDALAENLGPLYWRDQENASDGPLGPGPIWRTADIDWNTGTVLVHEIDETGEESRALRRVLFVLAAAVTAYWPDPVEEKKLADRDLEIEREAAARDFECMYWPTAQVLRWLAWRNPAFINRPWRRALMYGDPNYLGHPASEFLKAVQSGNLCGTVNGEKIPPSAWARIPSYKLLDADFLRKDVLKLWPLTSAKPRSAGRPSYKSEIVRVFKELNNAAAVDHTKPMTSVYPIIRKRITGTECPSKGLSDEVIRKWISPLWNGSPNAATVPETIK